MPTYTKVSGMPGAPFTGYYDSKDLPIKNGDTVRVPKGTTLHSFHPRKDGPYLSARAKTVKIDHLIPGQTLTVAYAETDEDGKINYWRCCMSGTDYRYVCQNLGIEGTDAEMDELLKAKAFLVPRSPVSDHHFEARVHVGSPTVRWPGASGYWVWADINAVEKVEG